MWKKKPYVMQPWSSCLCSFLNVHFLREQSLCPKHGQEEADHSFSDFVKKIFQLHKGVLKLDFVSLRESGVKEITVCQVLIVGQKRWSLELTT